MRLVIGKSYIVQRPVPSKRRGYRTILFTAYENKAKAQAAAHRFRREGSKNVRVFVYQ